MNRRNLLKMLAAVPFAILGIKPKDSNRWIQRPDDDGTILTFEREDSKPGT